MNDHIESTDTVASDERPLQSADGTVPQPSPGAAVKHPSSPPISLAGYEIIRELGRGGMGVVYEARQIRLQRLVALKMIIGGGHAGPQALERFRVEAEAIARLQHPHIVQIHEIGEHEGLPYFSLEFCAGGSLDAKLKVNPLPARQAAELLEKLARAVVTAHQKGILHRDLKPANVLLAEDGTPKIADFGLAKKLDDDSARTGSHAIMGTPSYMAPEQASGTTKSVGPAADVYSLGAILYECLTGRPPFKGATVLETLDLVREQALVPPRYMVTSVPKDLEAICLKCLQKDPHRRYATAADLAVDLAKFLNGEAVSISGTGTGLKWIAAALERVQLKAQFAQYGSLLLALAPVMLLTEIWATMVFWYDWPSYMFQVAQVMRLVALVAVVGYFRNWRLMPANPFERQLWVTWLGCMLASSALGLSSRLASGTSFALPELRIYPSLSCVTALAFFTLAPSIWAYCAIFGLGFLAAAFLMTINLQWAPLTYGLTWAITLLLIGFRLRRLGKDEPG